MGPVAAVPRIRNFKLEISNSSSPVYLKSQIANRKRKTVIPNRQPQIANRESRIANPKIPDKKRAGPPYCHNKSSSLQPTSMRTGLFPNSPSRKAVTYADGQEKAGPPTLHAQIRAELCQKSEGIRS